MLYRSSPSEPDKRRAGRWDFTWASNLGRKTDMRTNGNTDEMEKVQEEVERQMGMEM